MANFEDENYALGRITALELAVLWCGVIWLQIVGLVTKTVLHHILHAIPLAVLGFIRGGYWTRHTRAMTGLAWVLMLSVFTPMIWHALSRGIVFTDRTLAYTWLAVGMLIIAAGWSAVSIAALIAQPSRWFLVLFTILLAGCAMAVIQPFLGSFLELPVSRVLSGQTRWMPVLGVEVFLVAGLIWGIVRLAVRPPRPPITLVVSLAQIIYWIAFIACMIVGLAIDEM